MPELCLRVLHIRACQLQPRCMRTSKHLPVDPAYAQLPSCRLYKPSQYAVVPHRRTLRYGSKDQIIWTGRFNGRIAPHGITRPNFDGDCLKPVNTVYHTAVHRNGCIASFALRCTPIATATALVDCDGARVNVLVSERNQFARSHSRIHGYVHHRFLGTRQFFRCRCFGSSELECRCLQFSYLLVLPPTAIQASGAVVLIYIGAVILACGVVSLGIGLLRHAPFSISGQ